MGWEAVVVTGSAYTCPAVAHIPPDLVTDGFYRLDDPTHSIIDPVRQEAYRKSSEGVKNVGLAIVAAADDYRNTGSRSAAQCAMTQILTLAQEHALAGKMSSNQAYYVQGWVAGAIAIAYLKIRQAGLATPQDTETIANWMKASENKRNNTTMLTKRRDTEIARIIICTGREWKSPQSDGHRTIAKTSIGRWRLTTMESIRYSQTDHFP